MADVTIRGIPDEDVEAFRDSFQVSPFVEHVGVEWDLISPDRVEAHVEVGPRHHQPYGIVHGGVHATIVETVSSVGAALNVYDDGRGVVGVSNTTDFIRAHREGRLDVTAEPLHVGRTQQLWEVVISRAGDGRQVARGKVRLHNVDAEQLG